MINMTRAVLRYTAFRDLAIKNRETDHRSGEAWQYAINKVMAMAPDQFPIVGDAYDLDNMPSGLGVHIRHCCERHGCKYGTDEACPVALGEFEKDHQCEFCEFEQGDKEQADALLRITEWATEAPATWPKNHQQYGEGLEAARKRVREMLGLEED